MDFRYSLFYRLAKISMEIISFGNFIHKWEASSGQSKCTVQTIMVHNLGKMEETASLQKTLLQLDTPQHDCEMWLYGLMKLRLSCLGRKKMHA